MNWKSKDDCYLMDNNRKNNAMNNLHFSEISLLFEKNEVEPNDFFTPYTRILKNNDKYPKKANKK